MLASQRPIVYEFSPRNRIHLITLQQIYHFSILHLQRPQFSLELLYVSMLPLVAFHDQQILPSSDS
jgi:hypothetical protein